MTGLDKIIFRISLVPCSHFSALKTLFIYTLRTAGEPHLECDPDSQLTPFPLLHRARLSISVIQCRPRHNTIVSLGSHVGKQSEGKEERQRSTICGRETCSHKSCFSFVSAVQPHLNEDRERGSSLDRRGRWGIQRRIGHNALWAVPKPAVFHSVGVQAVKCSRAGIERAQEKR